MEDCWARDPAQRPTMEAVATRLRNILAAGGLREHLVAGSGWCAAVCSCTACGLARVAVAERAADVATRTIRILMLRSDGNIVYPS